jgi:hypothetical protein
MTRTKTHKRKHTEEELAALKVELTAIKRRNLSRMQELTQKAYESLVGIEK